jgi:hypothetical protein
MEASGTKWSTWNPDDVSDQIGAAMKVLTAAILFCLAFSQSSEPGKQTDREHDGFAGPVKKMHEDWSPITENWSDIRPGTRCRRSTKFYDDAGRVTQSSLYPGSCGSDELREYYTYDQEGNQMSREEEILGPGSNPPPPPMPPPGGVQDQGPGKKIFKYDSQGRLAEFFVRWASGKIAYRIVYTHDAENRISESKSLDSDGKLNSRNAYSYEGQNRFPSKRAYFDSSDKIRGEYTYSEYEFNSHGDWIKRKESDRESNGSVRILLSYRKIEYYDK